MSSGGNSPAQTMTKLTNIGIRFSDLLTKEIKYLRERADQDRDLDPVPAWGDRAISGWPMAVPTPRVRLAGRRRCTFLIIPLFKGAKAAPLPG